MADNLNIPTVAAAQNQKEVTINAATDQLSSALADYLSASLASADYTLTLSNFQNYAGFATTGNAVARNFNVPASKRALFYVQNGGSASVSVVVGSTSLSVGAGAVGFFQTDGTTNGLASIVPIAAGGEADVGFIMSGLPLTGQKINYPLNIAAKLVTGLTGTHVSVGTNPTSTATFTLNKNGSSIGTIAIGTGGAPTITFTSDISFAIGDVFNLTAPSPQDSTLSDIGFNFKFTKL